MYQQSDVFSWDFDKMAYIVVHEIPTGVGSKIT